MAIFIFRFSRSINIPCRIVEYTSTAYLDLVLIKNVIFIGEKNFDYYFIS